MVVYAGPAGSNPVVDQLNRRIEKLEAALKPFAYAGARLLYYGGSEVDEKAAVHAVSDAHESEDQLHSTKEEILRTGHLLVATKTMGMDDLEGEF